MGEPPELINRIQKRAITTRLKRARPYRYLKHQRRFEPWSKRAKTKQLIAITPTNQTWPSQKHPQFLTSVVGEIFPFYQIIANTFLRKSLLRKWWESQIGSNRNHQELLSSQWFLSNCWTHSSSSITGFDVELHETIIRTASGRQRCCSQR